MLTKNDLLTILLDLEEKENSPELTDKINQLMTNRNIDLDILKFVNDKRPLEVGEFYTKLRQNYNDKKSSLYINILRETQSPEEAPITLGALALQIMLFGKKIENKKSFFNCTRLKEILDCLSYSIFNCSSFSSAFFLLPLILYPVGIHFGFLLP